MNTKEKKRSQGKKNPIHSGQATRIHRSSANEHRGSAAASPAKRSGEKKSREPVKTSPDVVYLPPKPFSRNRLILRLATVAAIVVALLLGLSVFFKVDESKVLVSGNIKYTALDIWEASGIADGDNLLTFSRARAAAKIRAALPYVDDIRVGIKLPDTVMIDVIEVEVPYAIQARDGSWWLISSSGKIIEKARNGEQGGYTRILGVQLDAPQQGSQAAAFENATLPTDGEGNTLPLTVTQTQRLKTALDIAEYLEMNGIIGKATSVDVTTMSDLRLMYGQQYQVKLGNDMQLSYKISCMKYVVEKLDGYQSGILDISFTIWPDRVGYTPFDGDFGSILEIP